MNEIKEKIKIFGEGLRKNRIKVLAISALIAFVVSIIFLYKEKNKYSESIENTYNMAFYQLVDDIQNVEVYLAKSMISSSPESGIKSLTYVWREANMAQTYLSMLPISSSELENTEKFLNQVSDYSYAISRKNMNNEEISQSELDNLDKLHEYSMNLKNTLNQLSVDLNDGKITWKELTKKTNNTFMGHVSNASKDSFSSVEENFHEYAGLIYDGAFSEHMTNPERKGLTGEDIDENRAEEIAKEFCNEKKISKVERLGVTQNTNIETYNFQMKTDKDDTIWVSVSKKGGHIVSMNSNRVVNEEKIVQDEIDKIVDEYLNSKNFKNMRKTYYSKNNGVETINFAYEQNDVIMYPDLIKVKVAMDNGEILGIETSGYLNSHTERSIAEIKIGEEEARAKINTRLEVESSQLAMIPTEFNTEILCWEFKGRVKDREFLVYINVENGREEDILVILDSEQGTLTM